MRPPGDTPRRLAGRRRARLLPTLTLAGLALAPPAPARTAEVEFRGLLDLVATQRGDAFDANLLTRGDCAFDPFGVRLFVDAQVEDRLQVYLQGVVHDAVAPYLDGAYLVFTPMPARDLNLMAGKIPWVIGTYGPRTYSDKNPLVGAPLMYQHHTTLLWYALPPDADALLAAAGSGQTGVSYGSFTMGPGQPVVDDSYWDVGVVLTGSARPLEFAAGVVAGTPSWGSTGQDDNSGKCVLGRLGLAPHPGLRVGVSGAYGPYLEQDLDPEMPPGRAVNDYAQRLAMADLEVQAGRFELRAEAAHNVWETPTVGDLALATGYVEARLAFSSGAYLAGRFDVMRFGDITDSSGQSRGWDADQSRIETGLGYRFTRSVVGKVVWQHTDQDGGAPGTPGTFDLAAAQLSVRF